MTAVHNPNKEKKIKKREGGGREMSSSKIPRPPNKTKTAKKSNELTQGINRVAFGTRDSAIRTTIQKSAGLPACVLSHGHKPFPSVARLIPLPQGPCYEWRSSRGGVPYSLRSVPQNIPERTRQRCSQTGRGTQPPSPNNSRRQTTKTDLAVTAIFKKTGKLEEAPLQ